VNSSLDKNGAFQPVAPVDLRDPQADAVSHSLAVLSTVYHYNHWIFDTIRGFLGRSIVEVGSGVGNITQFLLNADEVVCLEPFGPFRRYLAERFAAHLNVSVHPHRIEDCPNADVPAGRFDSVVCLNVLEHIADDAGALRRMGELLAPGGRVIVLVPAMQCIYGRMDEAMGHLRRYSAGSLRRAFRRAGLRVRSARYMNLIGAAAWWWQGRVLRRSKLSAAATRAFDRMVPMISAMERLLPAPAGQSLVMVGGA